MNKISLAFSILLLSCGLAFGMDFSKPILDGLDTPVTVDRDGKKVALTLGMVAAGALYGSYPDEKDLSGDEKARRGNLALKIAQGGDQQLSVEDTALLKKLIAKAYGPLIVARAWTLLDPKGANGEQPSDKLH